ncbi:urea carboxylase-associated family protein [Mycolicibacterium sp. D5.8-2]|uniref:urea carboxylase-associated family protein n=1 Tax=Mycolicibacterium sp. D5.8-2 TaxID=3085903 RepID=UPI00298CD3E0|nr:urea carboxylase-associated family protein [Mycolicibacterium sp. D5.8-2]MDW5615086.1 urea carboxylase-associated family protein [Mycolicibacterium sp. D5.8-2]
MNQRRELVEQFTLQKCSGRAFPLERGQVLRVTAHEGKQVADLKFINRGNPKEQFSSSWSVLLNTMEGTGTSHSITKLWSKPPFENVMLKVVRDDVARHFLNGSCSRRWAELSGGMNAVVEGDKTCWDLFDDALRPFGLGAEDTDSQGTFNVFMSVSHDNDGGLIFEAPRCRLGDAIEFEAEMDVLVAAVSCPDKNEINDFAPKGMQYEIFSRLDGY